MKEKKNTGKAGKYLRRLISDFEFRAFVSSSLSLFVTLVFAVYNLFLGIAYRTVWNAGISVYYILLTALRAFILSSERKQNKENLSQKQREEARKRIYFKQSFLLFLIDFALIVPISLMATEKRTVRYSTIPAITVAAYTTYKVAISAKNFLKTRKRGNLGVFMLKTVNLIDAAVAILSLQYTLIATFGDGIKGKMKTLTAVSSFSIWTLLLALSVATLVKAARLYRR